MWDKSYSKAFADDHSNLPQFIEIVFEKEVNTVEKDA